MVVVTASSCVNLVVEMNYERDVILSNFGAYIQTLRSLVGIGTSLRALRPFLVDMPTLVLLQI